MSLRHYDKQVCSFLTSVCQIYKSSHFATCGLTRLSSILIRDSNSSSPIFHLYWEAMLTAAAVATSNTRDLYFFWSSTMRLSTLPAHEMAFTYNHKASTEGEAREPLRTTGCLHNTKFTERLSSLQTSVASDHPPKI